jgi:rhodanese-related sulfurtransferase
MHEKEFGSWSTKILFANFALEGTAMYEPLLFVMTGLLAIVSGLIWGRRRARRREMLNHTITPEALHDLLDSDQKPEIVDLRLPLDFLVRTEMIPGAQKISPKEITLNPDMLAKDHDYVLYCTCPGEASGEAVLAAALKMGFLRVKLLAGGLEAWKRRGYPVIPYDKPFRLDPQ